MANNIPKEIFIHIPQNPSSLDGLTQKLYIKPTPEVMAHFKATNPHLKNHVDPGQLVILSPPGNQINNSSVGQLTQVAKRLDEGQKNLTASEREILAKHYDLLSNIADFSGVGYGLGMNYFTQHKNHVEQILREIQQEYIKSYGQYGNLKNAEFLRRRKILFMKLEQSLNRMAGHKAMGLDLDAEHIKRSLGLNTKSIIKQWKKEVGPIRSIDGYE